MASSRRHRGGYGKLIPSSMRREYTNSKPFFVLHNSLSESLSSGSCVNWRINESIMTSNRIGIRYSHGLVTWLPIPYNYQAKGSLRGQKARRGIALQ